jgi:three-Cys-motif partner protein
MERFNPLIQVQADALFTPEVRAWSLEKYKLVGSYCDIFTTGMRNKWDQLVYIDLFAGAGYAKIKESGKTYLNSALTAMSIPNPFSKYIFCEQDKARCDALGARCQRDFSGLNFQIIQGDSNVIIDQVLKAIPPYGRGNTLLPFCFVDPFSLNLKLSTIEALTKGLMDFLILQALYMDGNRNLEKYLKEESTKISDYLGVSNWREIFEADAATNKLNFVKFLADQYQNKMVGFGYQSAKHMHQIRSNEKNLPLYYLAFYSKHKRGEEFFEEVRKRVTPQTKMDF